MAILSTPQMENSTNIGQSQRTNCVTSHIQKTQTTLFDRLPWDTVGVILSKLDGVDHLKLAAVCRSLRSLVSDSFELEFVNRRYDDSTWASILAFLPKRLPALQKLEFRDCTISDEVLADWASGNATTLNNGTRVNSTATLTTSLIDTSISPTGSLGSNGTVSSSPSSSDIDDALNSSEDGSTSFWSNLQSISLISCSRIRGTFIPFLVAHVPELRSLICSRCFSLNLDSSLSVEASNDGFTSKLNELVVSHASVSLGAGWMRMFGSVRVLGLVNCELSAGSSALYDIPRFDSLEYLFLGGSTLRGVSLSRLLDLMIPPTAANGHSGSSNGRPSQVARKLKAVDATFLGRVDDRLTDEVWDMCQISSLQSVKYIVHQPEDITQQFGDHSVADVFEGASVQVASVVGHTVNCTNSYQQTPLHVAAIDNEMEVAEALMSLGCDLEIKDRGGCTPLFRAVEKGHLAMSSLLLESGAQKNTSNKNLEKPLYVAALKGYADIAELLLHWGCAPSEPNYDGWTPLHAACTGGHETIVDLLLIHDADPDIKNRYGLTPLHIAARQGLREAVTTLLAHGAGKDAKDEHGCTPADYALRDDYSDLVAILQGSRPARRMHQPSQRRRRGTVRR